MIFNMDRDSERYKKDQDLMFQALEERELLRKQAIEKEEAVKLENKILAAGVPRSVILDMSNAGKKSTTYYMPHATYRSFLPPTPCNLPPTFSCCPALSLDVYQNGNRGGDARNPV